MLPIAVLVLTPGPMVTTRVPRGEMARQAPSPLGVERSDYPGHRTMARAHAGHGLAGNPVAALGRLVSWILAPRQ